MNIDRMKPMLARLVRELPADGYVYEPKWDGFRCLASRRGDEVELCSRHGRPLGRYFPELVTALSQVAPREWVIDGEVLVVVDGHFDFASLMARLHPAASRVRELTARTPAVFVAFDLPALESEELFDVPFAERRERLVSVTAGAPRPPVFLTPATSDLAVAQRWLREFCGGGLDGVVAKHRDLRYQPGARAMLKVKHERTAECVVAGARVDPERPEILSLLLGLFDPDGVLQHVGVASSFARTRRRLLAQELAPLITGLEDHPWEHGFLLAGGPMGRLKGAAGRWSPGMTLDWLPLRPERVVEVSYTQVDDHRLRHPAKFVRWRPDRNPRSCELAQLDPPLVPSVQVLAS